MKNIHHLFPALLLVGCASTQSPTVMAGPGTLPKKHDVSDTARVRTPEQLKAYPVGRYEDPDDPNVMHESHTVYRAESSPDWNTAPNEPTDLPLGPGEMAVADPSQEHVALTADLEQRLKQEDQLLQTTYEQNEKLAEEIKALQDQQQHVLLPVPPAEPSVATPQPKSQANPPSQPSPVTPSPSTKTWGQWLWSKLHPTTNPKEN